MRYKFVMKSKPVAKLNMLFANFKNCFLGTAMLFAITNVIVVFTPLDDYIDIVSLPYFISFITIFAVAFVVLVCIFETTDKGVEITDKGLILHLGYVEFGIGSWYNFKVKFDFDKIQSIEFEEKSTKPKLFGISGEQLPTFWIYGADLTKPQLKITYKNCIYLIPLEENGLNKIKELQYEKL